MSAKLNYDYEVKQKARDLQKDFIRKYFPRSGERKELKVVCFPGAEGLEVTKIYDELDIKRRNIVGIECDPIAYKKIESLGLGIELFRGYDNDFFSSTDRKFGVISLDYQGYMEQSKEKLLRRISQNNLEDTAVVHTNFQGKRERVESQKSYRTTATVASMLSAMRSEKPDAEKIQDYKDRKKVLDESELLELRSSALTRKVVFALASEMRGPNDFHKIVYQFSDTVKELRDISQKMLEAYTDKDTDLDMHTDLLIGNLLMPHVMQNVGHYESATGVPRQLLQLAYIVSGRDHITQVRSHESYKYISDDGTPMLGDMVLMKRLPTHFTSRLKLDLVKVPRSYIKFPIVQLMTDLGKELSSIPLPAFTDAVNHIVPRVYFEGKPAIGRVAQRAIDLVRREALEINDGDNIIANEYERKFLGSSFKPIATNDDIRDALVNGTFEQLTQTHRVDQSSVPAVKAHVTMGTYSPGVKERVPAQKIEDPVKMQAIEMLKAGKTPGEVSMILPITKGQASAYKAWMTMGKY